jgi:hypothetical protein
MLRVVVINQGPAHVLCHSYPAIVVLHVAREFIGALVIPRLHLIEPGRHHTVLDLWYTVLAFQLVLLVGGCKNG